MSEHANNPSASNELRYLAVIPARGGSKRVLRKNLRLLGGKPLLSYTIEAANQSHLLDKVIVSTDDKEIAELALSSGVEVPFLRPAELAQDSSAVIAALQHLVENIEKDGIVIHALVLLQPTSPFRTAAHIDEAISLFETSGADTVTAVRESREHPYYSWTISEKKLVPFFTMKHQSMVRQELPSALVENGSIYIIKRTLLDSDKLYGENTVPYLMDNHSSLDIDTMEDIHWAEFLLSQVDAGDRERVELPEKLA